MFLQVSMLQDIYQVLGVHVNFTNLRESLIVFRIKSSLWQLPRFQLYLYQNNHVGPLLPCSEIVGQINKPTNSHLNISMD